MHQHADDECAADDRPQQDTAAAGQSYASPRPDANSTMKDAATFQIRKVIPWPISQGIVK